jgi:hypothetical protein
MDPRRIAESRKLRPEQESMSYLTCSFCKAKTYEDMPAGWFQPVRIAGTDTVYSYQGLYCSVVCLARAMAKKAIKYLNAELLKTDAAIDGAVRVNRRKSRMNKNTTAKREHEIDRKQAYLESRQQRLRHLESLMVAPPVPANDKSLRNRTGRDDHLELGVYTREPDKRSPVFPVEIRKGES